MIFPKNVQFEKKDKDWPCYKTENAKFHCTLFNPIRNFRIQNIVLVPLLTIKYKRLKKERKTVLLRMFLFEILQKGLVAKPNMRIAAELSYIVVSTKMGGIGLGSLKINFSSTISK